MHTTQYDELLSSNMCSNFIVKGHAMQNQRGWKWKLYLQCLPAATPRLIFSQMSWDVQVAIPSACATKSIVELATSHASQVNMFPTSSLSLDV